MPIRKKATVITPCLAEDELFCLNTYIGDTHIRVNERPSTYTDGTIANIDVADTLYDTGPYTPKLKPADFEPLKRQLSEAMQESGIKGMILGTTWEHKDTDGRGAVGFTIHFTDQATLEALRKTMRIFNRQLGLRDNFAGMDMTEETQCGRRRCNISGWKEDVEKMKHEMDLVFPKHEIRRAPEAVQTAYSELSQSMDNALKAMGKYREDKEYAREEKGFRSSIRDARDRYGFKGSNMMDVAEFSRKHGGGYRAREEALDKQRRHAEQGKGESEVAP